MPEQVIQVENLIKRYGELEAVRGVSFSVSEGEVFGLLGPNGAGKTTTIEILEGLRNLDGGRVSVCGLDPQREPEKLKNEIGAALQSTSLSVDEFPLSGWRDHQLAPGRITHS